MLDFKKLLKIMKFELWKKEESLNFGNVEGKVAENKRIHPKSDPTSLTTHISSIIKRNTRYCELWLTNKCVWKVCHQFWTSTLMMANRSPTVHHQG